MEPQKTDHPPEHIKTLYNLYGAFAASIVLSVLPFPSAAILSALFFIGVMIAAYVVRGRAEDHDLAYDHAHYIIRTIWIAGFFTMLTTAVACAYMLGRIDYEPFFPCMDAISAQGVAAIESMGMQEIHGLVEPCVEPFISGNWTLLMNALLIAGGPIILYMVFRLGKGMSRVRKGHRVASEKSWF